MFVGPLFEKLVFALMFSARVKAVCSFVLTKEVFAHMAQQKPTIYQKAKALVGWVRDWLRRHGFANLAEYGETDVLHLLNGARKALRDPDGNGPKRGMTPTVLSVRKVPGAKNAKELLPSVLLNVQDDAGDAILAEPHAMGNSGNLDTNEMPTVLRRGPVEALSEYVGTPGLFPVRVDSD